MLIEEEKIDSYFLILTSLTGIHLLQKRIPNYI